MAEEQTWTKLVELAQQGHEDSMNKLARGVKGRLCAYIYRVTLDHDLTQDLSQEVLLQMVKSLNRLDNAERFWPWLYRVTQSKIQQHYKTRKRKVSVTKSAAYEEHLSRQSDYHQDDGMRVLAQKELSKKVMVAMKQIKQQYRAVLSLRCFEQLSYSDIAVTMQCTEVRARVLFFRAKQALKKQLTHQGLSKGLLLMCLGVFGKLTAPAEAASSTVTVSAASTKVGLTAAIIATISTKLGVATMTAAAVGLVGVGSISVLSESPLPQRPEVKSLHYTTQLRNYDTGAQSSLSKGAYEQWFYFPDGIDGPAFFRMQRWNPQQKEKLCAWLQNGEGNYYYSSGENKIHINNYRVFWSSLKVCRLPTDTQEFTDFLTQVEGDVRGVDYDRDRHTGLLANAVDKRFADARNFRTNYSYNTLDEEQFQYNWSDDVAIVDGRDQMHKRGWTYFRINGQINSQNISGRGQIPFVYDASSEHPAWMTLNIGEKLEVIDSKNVAYLRLAEKTVPETYSGGSFFQGLGQPWMGIHTIDIVRRDAVAKRLWFKTEPSKNKKDIIVTVYQENEPVKTALVYTIDWEKDVIKNIRFDVEGRTKGSLNFSYLQDIENIGDEFVEPAISDNPPDDAQKNPETLWLIRLAQGNLGK